MPLIGGVATHIDLPAPAQELAGCLSNGRVGGAVGAGVVSGSAWPCAKR